MKVLIIWGIISGLGIICGRRGSFAELDIAERAKKRYELARGRTRARTEAAENVESLWKAVFLLPRSPSVSQLLRQKKREIETKGMQAAISVTEGEVIEPKTVKDASAKLSSLITRFRKADMKSRIPLLHWATFYGNTNACF